MVKAASAAEPDAPVTAPVDLDKVKPNESGVVPILMYHNITGDKIYQMKYPVEMFRQDLQWLYDHNYRPINLSDFVKGRIDVPAGMSPVVLTFDDSLKSQFCYLNDGALDPNCVVAIMDKFHQDHPDWRTRATFFIIDGSSTLPPPFYQKKYVKQKLEFLVKQGYEIGNHTVHHPRMNRLTDAAAEEEIAGCVKAIHKYLPDYAVNTIALPYGLFPKNNNLLPSGDAGGQSYANSCAMAAGWGPAPSPIDKSFHPYDLGRIQAGDKQFQSHWWLQYLEAHKDKKFVSDGVIGTFTVPHGDVAQVDKKRVDALGLELRTYGGPVHVARALHRRDPKDELIKHAAPITSP